MTTYEQAMAIGAQRYSDVLSMLNAAGLTSVFTQTGGMCAAIETCLEEGYTLLLTDAQDSLAWERQSHQGWGVGLYGPGSEHDDGPLAFASDEDGSVHRLLPLIRRVLTAPYWNS